MLLVFSEGLVEYRREASNVLTPRGVSGDGVAVCAAAVLLGRQIAEVSGNPSVPVSFVSAVGDDAGGRSIKSYCEQNGISTSLISIMPRGKTAGWEFLPDAGQTKRAIAYVNREAENCPIDWMLRFSWPDLSAHIRKQNGMMLVVSGIAATRPATEATFAKMLEVLGSAKSQGATIIVDPNTRLRLFSTPAHPEGCPVFARDRLSRLFSLADIALPSFPDDICPQGTSVFPWLSPDEVAHGFHGLGVRTVIVKLGRDGSWLYVDGKRLYVVPPPQAEVLNTLGAGDAYLGGLAAALAAGLSIREAMTLGSIGAGCQLRNREGAALPAKLAPPPSIVRSAMSSGDRDL